MSFQETFDISYYYYQYCYIDCQQKNVSDKLDKKS